MKMLKPLSIACAAIIAVAGQFTTSYVFASQETKTKIEDPYSANQSNSPWTLSMQNIKTQSGVAVAGASTILNNGTQGFSSYTPYFKDQTTVLSGYGSTNVGVGCDGINLGGIIDGQLSQYQQMVEEFIQNAPALAIMYLAYSQPTVKAVIDELNNVSQFGLDLTNMSCSGVRAIADKAAEEKAQSVAEARCTAQAGFKDPNCMSDDGLLENVTSVMRDTKKTVTDRSNQYLGKVSSATGGLVQFNGSVGGNEIGGTGPTGGASKPAKGVRQEACSNIKSEGLRTMILASSGMPCDDIENYGALLPDYQISDNGESGVIPRSMTLRKLASDMVVKYEGWVTEVVNAKESEYVTTDAFKAIYNRTGVTMSVIQHRQINQKMRANPAQGIAIIRNIAQLISLKDLNQIVANLEVAVLTGIQNQPDDEVLSGLRVQQYRHAIDSLNAELKSLTQEINMDLQRNSIVNKTP